jgi:signal transduction histidine kinase
MDDWDQVREKIKELENSYLKSSPDVRSTLDNISVADFWKRRYEEEKEVWEKMLAEKEKEQAQILQKFLKDEEGIRDLNFKIKELEQSLRSEKAVWEERSRAKTIEAELEKKRIEWEDRLAMLKEENEQLKKRIREGDDLTGEETRRRQQMESEKVRMEEELKTLQERISSGKLQEQERIEQLESEKKSLQDQLEELETLKREGKEKVDGIEKELAILHLERERHLELIEERQKEQFLAFEDLARGFAHKVRNNLSIMAGILQMCENNFKMSEDLKRQMLTVRENAQSMLAVIEEFLFLAKMPEMNFQTLSINELLDNALFAIGETAKSRGVQIEKKFSQDVPVVPADSNLLSDALRQIILNAVEASPAGSSVEISSGFEPRSGKVIIRILDSGKGIPENQSKKIFQPYFSTKKGKKGLGLTIAKRAVELHRGSLSISSAKDQGTTATMQIPVKSG